MQFEIVLKAEQKTIPLRQVPGLIAAAMHPEPKEGRTAAYLSELTEAENEQRSVLMGSVRYGYLTILSSKTNLPTEENNPLAVVTVEALTQYAGQFSVGVRIA